MTFESTNDSSTLNALPLQTNGARWVRIAEGLELLERMARAETDPTRQDAIWNALAEAKCN